MIELSTLAQEIQSKLNSAQDLYEFNIIADTGKFKASKRDKNTVVEIVNGRLILNDSDVSSVSTGAIFSTQSCTLKIIMKMVQDEEDTFDANGKIYSYGNITRIKSMRDILDGVFQENTAEEKEINGVSYVISTVFSFAQTGGRTQDTKLGDCFVFSINIYYTFVKQGINARKAQFFLDGVEIPYQTFTMYRTPTMDGNVYSKTSNSATKNLASQSGFSVSFELPALLDDNTAKMFDYMFDGELNQAHLLRVKIKDTVKDYLVTFGENTLQGEIVLNLGQSMSLVECVDDYDLITFNNKLFIYDDNAQAYLFGANGGPIKAINGKASVFVDNADKIVSTVELSASWLERI